jgi:hypothetical protein
MDLTPQKLKDRYSSLNDDELLRLWELDTLIATARPILEAELKSRGVEPDKLELPRNNDHSKNPANRSSKNGWSNQSYSQVSRTRKIIGWLFFSVLLGAIMSYSRHLTDVGIEYAWAEAKEFVTGQPMEESISDENAQ